MAGPSLTKIAEFFVQISSRGVDAVNLALGQIGGNLSNLAQQAQQMGQGMAQSMAQAGGGIAAVAARLGQAAAAIGGGTLQAAQSAGAALGGLARGAATAGAAVGRALRSAAVSIGLGPVVQEAEDALARLRKDFGELAGAVGSALSPAVARVREVLGGLGDAGIAALGGLGRAARAVGGALAAIGGKAKGAKDWLGEQFGALGRAIKVGFEVDLGDGRKVGIFRSQLSEILELTQRLGQAKGLSREQQADRSVIGLAGAYRGATEGVVALDRALSPITGRLYGLVQAGIAASGAGQVMAYQWEIISQQMASVFAPQVQMVIDKLAQVVRWFHSLNGEQQAQIRTWGLVAGGIMLAARVLPQVIASVQGLSTAFTALRVVLTGLTMSNPWLLAIAAIVGLIALVVASTVGWEGAIRGVMDATRPMADMMRAVYEVMKDVGEAARTWLGTLVEVASKLLEIAGIKADKGAIEKGVKDSFTLGGSFKSIMEMLGKAKAEKPGERGLLGKFLNNPVVGSLFAFPLAVADKMGGKKVQPKKSMLDAAAGAFESSEATYKRIAMKSRFAGTAKKDPQEAALDWLEKIYASIESAKGVAGALKPPMVK